MWAEFVIGSLLAPRVFFPRFLVILTPQKLTNSIPIRLGNSGQEESPRKEFIA